MFPLCTDWLPRDRSWTLIGRHKWNDMRIWESCVTHKEPWSDFLFLISKPLKNSAKAVWQPNGAFLGKLKPSFPFQRCIFSYLSRTLTLERPLFSVRCELGPRTTKRGPQRMAYRDLEGRKASGTGTRPCKVCMGHVMPNVRGHRGPLWPGAHVQGPGWEGPETKTLNVIVI